MEVYMTVVSNNMNEIMKTLTIISTVMLPLSLIASAYGMNVAFPGFGDASGVLGALALMGGTAAAPPCIFRRGKWAGPPPSRRPWATTRFGMPCLDHPRYA